MKIAFLGYPEFLHSLLYYLQGTPFLEENNIDIYFVKNKKRKKVSEYIKSASWGKLLYVKDYFLYKKQIGKMLHERFPENDISFIDSHPSIKIIPFNGLENIAGMEQYDYFIVGTYSWRISDEFINKPKNKMLNIHFSYLPELRGGYPSYIDAYQHKPYSGVSIHEMEKGWDAGDILLQKKIPISPNATTYDRRVLLSKNAAELLNQLHQAGFKVERSKQNTAQATYCSKILKAKREISSMQSHESLEGFITANSARHLFPFTFCIYHFSIFCILKATLTNESLPKKLTNKNGKIASYKNKYYLQFFEKTYLIQEYFYRGKLHSDSK